MSTGRITIHQTDEISLSIDARAYSVAAIKKAGYRLARVLTLVIDKVGEERTDVRLLLPPEADNNARERTVARFYRELGDETLREQVSAETAPIRALLLAHAFSRADLVVRDDAAEKDL